MSIDEAQGIWKKVLKQLKGALSLGVYKLHFQNSDIVSVDGDRWTIGVTSQFSAEELTKKFKGMLPSFIEEYYPHPLEIVFTEAKMRNTVKGHIETDEVQPSLFVQQNEDVYADTTMQVDDTRQVPRQNQPSSSQPTGSGGGSFFNGLNPNLIFDNFIVGKSNNVAYAASQAVSQNPGKGYNPLFIYGGVGLGKTHLMMAVGNAVLSKFPSKKISYFSSEKFTNEYIYSISTKSTDKFRERYRSCDIILIDDIQFIAGKDSTQEEFFHTFNDIVGRGGHVLMTSDRTPEEIPQLEERLSSRFKGGMMVDVGLPDYEMRVAIIDSKCQDMGEQVDRGAVDFLASRITTNTRELQGKLFQIISKLKTNGWVGSLENVRTAWGEESTQSASLGNAINPQRVLQVIHHHFSIKKSELLGSRRTKNFVIPRQIAMYLLNSEMGLPLERVGEILGGRDHTTVMHGVKQIELALSTNEQIRKEIQLIKQELSG
ncbi:MAG: chromosomal replication initiator protein DnaA [bacterium]|nr:chromosomal replication initiator protein DnaA [bacterium]